jgi:hypothetical protein
MFKNNVIRWLLPLPVFFAPLAAQTATAPLKIVAIEGDGAFNDIQKQLAQTPVVEVRDEYDRPVSDARVVFTLPSNGAGGEFAGGRKEYIGATDAQGRVSAPGLKPNSIEGRFPIRVTASAQGRHGSATLWQSNTTAGGESARSGSKKKWLIVGLLGAAGAGAAIGATHGGGHSSAGVGGAPTGTTLSPGTVSVGGPR